MFTISTGYEYAGSPLPRSRESRQHYIRPAVLSPPNHQYTGMTPLYLSHSPSKIGMKPRSPEKDKEKSEEDLKKAKELGMEPISGDGLHLTGANM